MFVFKYPEDPKEMLPLLSSLQHQVDEMKRLICEILDSDILTYDCPWNVSEQVYHDCLKAVGRPHIVSKTLWDTAGPVVEYKYLWRVATTRHDEVQDNLSVVPKSWEVSLYADGKVDKISRCDSVESAVESHASFVFECRNKFSEKETPDTQID